eukprot:PLAT12530.3.p1 GENE.PLAT12530.3~~PLAT12530.3.p1  ORF type:complete len:161 (+),score=6.36 PLAT12530.3:243-725(+)
MRYYQKQVIRMLCASLLELPRLQLVSLRSNDLWCSTGQYIGKAMAESTATQWILDDNPMLVKERPVPLLTKWRGGGAVTQLSLLRCPCGDDNIARKLVEAVVGSETVESVQLDFSQLRSRLCLSDMLKALQESTVKHVALRMPKHFSFEPDLRQYKHFGL